MLKFKDITGRTNLPEFIKKRFKFVLLNEKIVRIDIELSDVADNMVRMVFWRETIDSNCIEIADVFDFQDEKFYDYVQRNGTMGKIIIL